MRYKRLIAECGRPGSFIIELQDGRFAIVRSTPDEGSYVTVNRYLEAFLKWGGFHERSESDVTQEMIDAFNFNLQNSKNIFFQNAEDQV